MGVIQRQGIKNTIITYIGIMIGAVNIIFIQPKLLTPEELGLTRLLYDFSYIIGLAIPLGLPNIIVKYFPLFKNKENRHHGFAGFVLLVFFIGFIISTAALLSFKPFIVAKYQQEAGLFVTYFRFVIPFMFIVSAVTVTTAYCQSLFKSTIPSFLNDICIKLGTILITVLYFNRLISLDLYVYLFIGIYAIELIILIGYILLVDRLSLRFDKSLFATHSIGSILRFGLLLCLASFASIAIRKVDAVFLGTYSLKLVGIYTTAVFIASFIEVPLGALERISHTRIADSFARKDLPEVEKIYKDSVKFLLVIGGLLFIGINACTKYVYEYLPPVYIQSLHVVFIVSLGALINVSTGINSAILFYSRYYLLGTVLLFITLLITIGLNVWLIPLYGMYGAAYATAIAAAIYNVVKFIFIYVKFGFQPYTRISALVILLVATCSLAAIWLPAISRYPLVNILFSGGLLSAAYLACIYYMKAAPEIFNIVSSRIKKK